MGRKNFVYENLLKEYSALRSVEVEKVSTAKTKIAEANKQIEENEKKMAAATESGALETYAELSADNAKNLSIVKFYNGVIETAKQNASITPEKAKELYSKANEEIESIKNEYRAEMIAAFKPLIELSTKTYQQIALLEMAKNKIEANLLHHKQTLYPTHFFNMVMMAKLDQILQSDEYKKFNPDFSETEKLATSYNNWKAPAENVIKREAAKWI